MNDMQSLRMLILEMAVKAHAGEGAGSMVEAAKEFEAYVMWFGKVEMSTTFGPGAFEVQNRLKTGQTWDPGGMTWVDAS